MEISVTTGNIPEPEKKKHNTRSHLNRLLIALAKIYEDDSASIPERLQATRLASEILERRPVPRRKTDKEKMIEKALGAKPKPFPGKKNVAVPQSETPKT